MQRPRPTSSGGTNRRFFRHSVATSIATPVTALLQLLVLLALHPPIAEAQGFSFALPEAISGDLAGTRAVRMADMDRDGDLDVVASSLGNNIVWIENLDGDVSSVTTHYISEFGGGTWALDVGDIDSDGIPDVLATRTGSDEVQWFGRTSLTSNTWTMVSLGPFADPAVARLADMDSDGDLDVIVTSNSEDYIRWRRNENGLGTVWGAVSNLPIVGGADFKVVDLDQDGDLDFVVAGQLEDEIRWWQNTNGLGTLWSVTDLTGGLDGAWSVDVGDIDHDGDLDIAASGQEAGEIIILENSGSSPPTFTSSSLDDGFAGAREVRLVDIDQDGDLDVLGVSELSGELALWENWRGPSGIGDLQWRRWSISTMAAAAWSFDAGDLDGDGDLDLISARPFLSDPVVWFRNDSPHSRRTVGRGSVRELLASYGGGFNGVTIGDIDGDGAADIVAGGDAHLGWWTGPDSLNPGVRTGISAENGQYNNDLELADLDHDGDLDIVAASRATSPGSAFWWENLGAGATWVRQTVGFSNSSLVEVVDLFGTGERVIVTAGPNTNTSIRAYGPPFLTSGGQLTLVGTHGANAFAIGDMDRDGDLDLVAGGYGIASEAALMLAEQDSGSFTEVNLSDSRIDDLELIDWDGDGDLDIIAVNKSPGQILWFENLFSALVSTIACVFIGFPFI